MIPISVKEKRQEIKESITTPSPVREPRERVKDDFVEPQVQVGGTGLSLAGKLFGAALAGSLTFIVLSLVKPFGFSVDARFLTALVAATVYLFFHNAVVRALSNTGTAE